MLIYHDKKWWSVGDHHNLVPACGARNGAGNICCKEPGHSGRHYCPIKDVEFQEENHELLG